MSDESRRMFMNKGRPQPFHQPPKLTPRDRELIREIFRDTPATAYELAIAFGVARNTIYVYV